MSTTPRPSFPTTDLHNVSVGQSSLTAPETIRMDVNLY